MEVKDAKRKRACPTTSSLAVDIDRLSALPDCLIHTIMSFMKARQVVQTCVLSTRWRHLWHSTPCLNVEFDEFKMSACTVTSVSDTNNCEDDDNNFGKESEDFSHFAINLMFRHSVAGLDSFRLRAPPSKVGQAGRCIQRAMKYCAPDPVIQREGLSAGSSWRLKILHLSNVLQVPRFAKHVSSVCPSLEDLELQSCPCQYFRSITSYSLKNFVLKNCSMVELSDITAPRLKTLIIDGGWNQNTRPIVIMTPAVVYLHVAVNFAHFGGVISINEMPCLAKALIHRRGRVSESKLGGNILKLVCGVSNVKSLELKGFGTMVLGEECTPFQEFKNLRNLLLDNCDLTDDFHTLGLFLQNSPNLEKLTLQHCKFLNDSKQKKRTQKPNKPTSSDCQSLDVRCENLKLTEIIYKDDNVCQLVELLLRIAGKLPKNYIKLTKVD